MITLHPTGHEFQNVPIKREGQPVDSGFLGGPPAKPMVETVYIERRVPKQYEGRVHRLISDFLRDCGHDPEKI